MSDTKIFSLGDNGGASNNAALIASLCQQRGLDPNMVAAMMNNNRGGMGGWGDGSAWATVTRKIGKMTKTLANAVAALPAPDAMCVDKQ